MEVQDAMRVRGHLPLHRTANPLFTDVGFLLCPPRWSVWLVWILKDFETELGSKENTEFC